MGVLKEKLKKHHFRIIIIVFDLLILPFGLICKYLSGYMLTFNLPCIFTVFGGKCAGCGGTHFVKNLMSGNIIEAFFDNQFLFVWTVYLAVSLILLNLFLLFNMKFAKKALLVMYSSPALICFMASAFLFFIVRNIPLMINIISKIAELF